MIAQYPPMGWNSWDCWGAAVTEETVRRNAEYMAAHLRAYGWEYVVVDIEWYQPSAVNHTYAPFAPLSMDACGRLQPAVNRFPSARDGQGFRPLADYVHSLGLKFGIHIMRGVPRMAAHQQLPIADSEWSCADAANPNDVCAWNPDMYGTRADTQAARDWYGAIFRQYAEWGVDYVKCDDIAREYPRCEREIEIISEACRGCGRDIVLSLSPGPAPLERAEHLKTWANLWRVTDDFWDDWTLLKPMFERAQKWCVHAGPGHWPDQDMLPVGALRQCEDPNDWTRLTQAEQRTMMTLWCMVRSPLMIGGELSKNDGFTLRLLTNAPLLAIERETVAARCLRLTEQEAVFAAYRREGGGYIALFNLSDTERQIDCPPSVHELGDSPARELWSGDVTADGVLSARVAPHDCAVYQLSARL